MPWREIQYISSGFSLCAFIVAVIAFVLKRNVQEQRLRIESAPAKDRASLVARTLEFFNVNTAELTQDQQYEIVLVQIKARAERFRVLARVVMMLALTAAALSAYAISKTASASAEGEQSTSGAATTEASSSHSDRKIDSTKPDNRRQATSFYITRAVPGGSVARDNWIRGADGRWEEKYQNEIIIWVEDKLGTIDDCQGWILNRNDGLAVFVPLEGCRPLVMRVSRDEKHWSQFGNGEMQDVHY